MSLNCFLEDNDFPINGTIEEQNIATRNFIDNIPTDKVKEILIKNSETKNKFYNRILKKFGNTIDDYIENPRASTVLYIMKQFQLLDKTKHKIGIFMISEQDVVNSIELNQYTNNQLYDLLYYLDDIGELDNYLSMKEHVIPKYDDFYEDMNKKIYKEKQKKIINTEKVCPICNTIPYYDFEDVCDECMKNSSI